MSAVLNCTTCAAALVSLLASRKSWFVPARRQPPDLSRLSLNKGTPERVPLFLLSMDSLPPLVWPRHVSGFDSAAQPVVSGPSLPKLAAGTLRLPFIRRAFSLSIPWKVEPVFTELFDLDTSGRTDVTQAAVFIPLVDRPNGLHVMFTRRAAHLYNHAGQICFPGGRIESTDVDPVQAALRETWEEVGVE